MMIQQPAFKLGRLGLAALCLAIVLASCGPAVGTPPGSAQPTQAPVDQPAPPPTTAAPTSAAPAQPPTIAPTSAPATQTQPAAPAPSPTPMAVGDDEVAATQTVLDYYAAINQQAYDRAYHLWAQGGRSSNQTFEQFKQGFDGTVQVSVQLGKPSVQAGVVTVPIAIASVVNMTDQQQVRRFRGTYSVGRGANGWRITGANIAAVSGDTQPPADVGDPLALLQSYYAAINGRDFGRAYTYWSNNGAASQQTFTQFSQGFAATDHVTIDAGKPQIGGAAGSAYAETAIVIMATQKDGAQQTFCGTYTLRRLNVPPFDQFGWRMEQASIASVTNVQPGSDAEKQLLTNGCKP